MFVTFGSLTLWRCFRIQDQTNGEGIIFFHPQTKLHKTRMNDSIFIFLSILVIASGFTSFVLDQNWFSKINSYYKIPIYSLLGI